MKRSWEVWSKVSEAMWPPRLNGEITSIGTRKPRPIGPAIPCGVGGQRIDRQVLPCRAGRATGGAT